MNATERDELLCRLDERVAYLAKKVDALPCAECKADVALLKKRYGIIASISVIVLVTIDALLRKIP
jgi:hypothetical protein